MRTLLALVVLGLAGCGIYGPPERDAAPAAQTPPAEQNAEDEEKPE